MQDARFFLRNALPLGLALGLACSDDSPATDAGVPLDMGGDSARDAASGDASIADSGRVDATSDRDVPVEEGTWIGTPPRAPEGRGEPPVVFWPRPVFAHPDVPLVFTMVAYDPEHEAIQWGLEGAPEGMTIDRYGTIRWTPTGTSATFEVSADDGRGDPIRVPVSLRVDPSNFVFVAPGADGDGSIDAPYGDLRRALDAIAERGQGTVLIRGGEYDVAWNWERDGVQSPFRGARATPEAPIAVRAYPNEDVVIDCNEEGHGLWSFGGDYILFADLEVRRPAAAERAGIDTQGGSHTVIQNVTVRDANWSRRQNCTGFLLSAAESVCHRCSAYNNYDRESEHWNSSNYLLYADKGSDRAFVLDSYSEGSIAGYKIKHSGEGRLFVHGSIERGSNWGLATVDDGSVFDFNTLIENEVAVVAGLTDPGPFNHSMRVTNNTIVRPQHRALLVRDGYVEEGGFEFSANVVAADIEPGARESDFHLIMFYPYGDRVDGQLVSRTNCLYAPGASDLGFRANGRILGFDGWQALGLDADSTWGPIAFEGEGYALAEGSCPSNAGAW